MIRVIWTLAVLVQDHSREEHDLGQPKLERLRQHAKSLYEALEHRLDNDQLYVCAGVAEDRATGASAFSTCRILAIGELADR